jgi:hypothetical protein
MKKIDAYFHIAILITGIILARITWQPVWFVIGLGLFTFLPSDIVSRGRRS